MAEQTKDQLRLDNEQSFPNNNTGFITAEGLRSFNEDMIDSLATQVEADGLQSQITDNSASIEILSQSFLDYSSSLDDDFVSEAEFAAYTASVNADSASVSTRVTNLEDFSSSLDDSFVSETEFAAYTSSNDSRVDTLETSEAALNTYTGSNDGRVQSLETETGSLQAQIDALTTGSGIEVENEGTNIGTAFTLDFVGDSIEATYSGTTATITVDGLATTSSLNQLSSSVATEINDLVDATGSYATTGSNTFEGNQIVTGSIENVLGVGQQTLFTIDNADQSANVPVVKITSTGTQAVDKGALLQLESARGAGASLTPILNVRNDESDKFTIFTDGRHRINGNTTLTGSLKVTGSFEAPLQDGYVWVGSAGSSTQIPSSSIQGVQFPYTGSAQITGSLGVTGSITIDNAGQTGSVIDNVTDTYASADKVEHVVTLSQAEYDAIPSKDLNTLYLISGSDTGIVSASYAISASHADSSDFATNSDTASYILGTNVDGAVALADLATTSSYILGSNVDGQVSDSLNSVSASYAVSSSHSERADVSDIADVASFVSGANVEGAVDLAFTASYVAGANVDGTVANATTASYALTASYVENALSSSVSIYSSNTVVTGKNLSGGLISKGTPLFFTGSGTAGNIVGLFPADAGDPTRMPVGGIAGEDIIATEEGTILLDGFINGVDTSLFEPGDKIYVGVGGGYTNVAPTGSAFIQFLGNIEKSAVNGSGVIQMMGESRNLPNILEGYAWVGNSDSVPTAVATSSFGGGGAGEGFPYTGSADISGSLNVVGPISREQDGFSGSVVDNIIDTFTSVPSIDHIVTLTEAEYDGLGSVDENTLYIISGSTVVDETFPYSGSAQITGSLGVTGSITLSDGSDTGSVVDNIGGNTIPSVQHIVSIDSASYAALGTYDENTLYVVSGSTSAATLSPYTGSIRGNVTSVAETSNTASLDFSVGNFFSSSIDDNTHFEITNVEPGQTVLLKVNITNASPSVTFSSNVLQPSGNEYTASANTEVDILTFTSFDGTNTNLVAVNNLK